MLASSYISNALAKCLAIGLALSVSFCGDATSLFEENSDLSGFLPQSARQSRKEIKMEVESLPESVQQGQILPVQLEITNPSSNPITTEFLISVYASQDATFVEELDPWLYSTGVDSLDAGDSLTMVVPVSIPGNSNKFALGDWNIFIFADAANDINEVEEDDNLQGPWPITVEEATSRPDLVFAGLHNPLEDGADIQFEAGSKDVPIEIEIKNQGATSLYKEYYHVAFVLKPLSFSKHSGYNLGAANNWDIPVDFELEPGGSYMLTAYPDLTPYSSLSTGWYILEVEIDYNNNVIESNETNNTSSEYLLVRVKNY